MRGANRALTAAIASATFHVLLGAVPSGAEATRPIVWWQNRCRFELMTRVMEGSRWSRTRPQVELLAAHPDGGVLVAAEGPRCEPWLWRLTQDEAAEVVPIEVGGRPTSAVWVAGRWFVGTDRGLVSVEPGGQASLLVATFRSSLGTILFVPPREVTQAITCLGADGAGEVWFMRQMGLYTFSGDAAQWLKAFADEELAAPVPAVRDAPFFSGAFAPDPRHGGGYGYWRGRNGGGLLFARPELPLATEGRSMTKVEVALPGLASPVLQVDEEGVIWLAGETLTRVHLYRVTDTNVADVSPPAELIARSSVTRLASRHGVLYAATDGAGVIVRRDGVWETHPVTEHLPTMLGTDIRPVDQIVVDRDGGLWVSTRSCVVCTPPAD